MKIKVIAFLLICICSFSCKKEEIKEQLFVKRNNKEVGFNFTNDLTFSKDFNVYKYRNYYNGGGVAVGDVNNDGLVDIYMVANEKKNKLFLNKGNWKFEDVTEMSGVGGTKAWSTGATMVDINADGFLDIYVCNSGDVEGDNKENELFINNGNLTFTERAAEYGLNDKGYSTHASFFDYDKDGDLDAYILNNSFKAIGSFDLQKDLRNTRDELGGDKLLENRNGKFVDVSAKAGIYGSEIGFGLGITIGDVNNDGWEDIFISNDFFERDYLYINQKNGTFKEDLLNQMPAISGASMGADIADINNDGWNDIFVTEMLPSDYGRLKTVTTFEDWNRYQAGIKNGYHHQFTRNMLHLNRGNGTFSEIGRLAGVEASDWSWGALFFDMENDGNKDLFIANGIHRDLTNQDYLQYISNESVMRALITGEGVDYKKLIEIIPSVKVPNHAYRNLGNLQFESNKQIGLQDSSFSNGSAYGDFDNDGDLDLVVNNLNMESFIYENKSKEVTKNNHIKLILKGSGLNTLAIGSRVEVKADSTTYYYEQQPTRGFQSSMDPRLNVGVGKATKVDIKVIWPDGSITESKAVSVNQSITLEQSKATITAPTSNETKSLAGIIDGSSLEYKHVENEVNEFNRENLLFHMLSTRGPCASKGDLNGDKIEDLVIPGSAGDATKIYFGRSDGSFTLQTNGILESLKSAEHIKCMIFDTDKDGDLDIYLASGGTEVSEFSPELDDLILINDGKGGFTNKIDVSPSNDNKISTGAIAYADIDQDGDEDIFVGERSKIGRYGAKGSGYILLNDGKSNFSDATKKLCPQLQNLGMITDAKWVDIDGDKLVDLIVVGEFMDVNIFKNQQGSFKLIERKEPLNGWWNTIEASDIDNDGDQDLVLGNHGLNSRFKASRSLKIELYHSDFDGNGFVESILSKQHQNGKSYPYPLRHNLMARLPILKKKYPDFVTFKDAGMADIFTREQLKSAEISNLSVLQSGIMLNDGKGNFTFSPLPIEAQFSPIYAIILIDVNKDGKLDIVTGGNLYNVQPEFGRYDASYGNILINQGNGGFKDESLKYKFSIKGEIRSFLEVNGNLLAFRNNDAVASYKLN